MNWNWEMDGWIVAAGVLSALNAALLGNFLLLRRMAMLGDAISHAVLPGIAVAFLLAGSRGSVWMFPGAVVTGVLTAALTQWIRDAGRVDEGAAMGVVFTSLFAMGLVLVVRAARHVDLDPGCVLYGNLVTVPLDRAAIWPGWLDWEVPRVVQRLGAILTINGVVVWLLFKEFRLAAFDPALAGTMGFPPWLLHYLLMVLVAVTAVACFESVGNVLVVAMMVVPGAAATLITGRLVPMIAWSLTLAVVSAIAGHLAAIAVPVWFGWGSTSTPGMMAVVAGGLFVCAWLAGPRQGLAWRWMQQRRLAARILREDILGLAWRWQERSAGGATSGEPGAGSGETPDLSWLATASGRRVAEIAAGVRGLVRRGLLQVDGGKIRLTSAGEAEAANLVRSHRLWEQYLVQEADMLADRIHPAAERLEHFTGESLRRELDRTAGSGLDPHGAPIPPEH